MVHLNSKRPTLLRLIKCNNQEREGKKISPHPQLPNKSHLPFLSAIGHSHTSIPTLLGLLSPSSATRPYDQFSHAHNYLDDDLISSLDAIHLHHGLNVVGVEMRQVEHILVLPQFWNIHSVCLQVPHLFLLITALTLYQISFPDIGRLMDDTLAKNTHTN